MRKVTVFVRFEGGGGHFFHSVIFKVVQGELVKGPRHAGRFRHFRHRPCGPCLFDKAGFCLRFRLSAGGDVVSVAAESQFVSDRGLSAGMCAEVRGKSAKSDNSCKCFVY